MIIKSIELNNFRIYKGNNPIDLTVSDNKNIVIISGKNGYGKTTFLMSLVWCLYGKQMSDVDEIYKKEIKNYGNYNRYIKNNLNKLAKDEGKTNFSVSVTFNDITTIPDVPCKELKITRTYYTEGNKEEELEIIIDGYQNEIVDEIGAEHFIRDFIMPKEIAKFFFFDAEKIVSLAEIHTPEQRQKLSKAYAEVLGIKQYQNLKEDLEQYINKLKSETANKKEKKELNDLKSEKENAKIEVEDLLNKIEEKEEEESSLKFEIDKLQEKLIRLGSVITVEELNKLREDRDELEKHNKILYAELKKYYEFIPFAISGRILNDVSVQIDDERNFINQKHTNDKQEKLTDNIINDLIKVKHPDDLVITYKVQDFYVKTIKELMNKHLGEVKSNSSKLNILHNFSEGQKAEYNQFINNIKLTLKEKFHYFSSEYINSKNKLLSINKQIKLAEEKSEDALVKADREQKAKLEIEYKRKIEEIGVLKNKVEENKNLIIQAKKEINRISTKLKVSKDKLKISKEVEQTIQYLKTFINDFKIEKKNSLSKRIKESLEILLHKKTFIKEVSVEIFEDNIEINLIDSKGKDINKDSLSKGEQQMYATALLKALVDESNIEFPVFIDSPMQKFDVDHSKSIVKHFYPNVSKQVILFPLLQKELSEDEFNILLPNVSKTFLILNKDDSQSHFYEVKETKELFKEFNKIN